MVTLARQCVRFQIACDALLRVIDRGLQFQRSEANICDTCIGHAVLRLHDAWALRCRAIVLLSARGGVVTRTGRMLPASAVLGRKFHPVTWLRRNWTSRQMDSQWEPDWHMPDQALRAARLLGVANLSTLMDGFGAATCLEDLRGTRNVIAHSLPATWVRLRTLERKLGLTGRETPAEFAISRSLGVGPRYVELWAGDLMASIRAATE